MSVPPSCDCHSSTSVDTGADATQGLWATAGEMEEPVAEEAEHNGDTRLRKSNSEAMMVMEGVLDEAEAEDNDHKVPIPLTEAEVEVQSEGREAGADDPNKLKGEPVVHEVVEDSIDEVGAGNNPLVIVFAFAELPAIEFEMVTSQLQRFVPEKNQELT